jgi:hypothetical protein
MQFFSKVVDGKFNFKSAIKYPAYINNQKIHSFILNGFFNLYYIVKIYSTFSTLASAILA